VLRILPGPSIQKYSRLRKKEFEHTENAGSMMASFLLQKKGVVAIENFEHSNKISPFLHHYTHPSVK
jgi:hypothetical protein